MKIRKDDKVLVVSGKDKGKTGKVVKVLPLDEMVVVEGINVRKKHLRPKKEGQKWQIVERSLPFHVSNVQLICGNCEKPVRVAYKIEAQKKVRVCKKCQSEI